MSLLLALAPALQAATTCLDVDAFNARGGGPVDAVTVRFDVTGVYPTDFPGTKGALFDLADTTCDGASAALKVYGPDDPPNTAHPAGTLKLEVNDPCHGPDGETWASPNPSEVVFEDGSERCEVEAWVDPASFGYVLDCDGGVFAADGDNLFPLAVDRVTLLSLTDGSTWSMDRAVVTWSEVCFEEDEPSPGVDTGDDGAPVEESAVLEPVDDVTVALAWPDSVDPDAWDLSVGLDDSEVYLRFDLGAVEGTVTAATLSLHALPDSWAEGSGAEAWVAGSADWSEDTLTWNERPSGTGAVLDRVAPVVSDTAYTWDVTDGVRAGEVVALALLPGVADDNGVHFHASESSATLGPRLEVVFEAANPEDTGAPSGDDPSRGGGDTDDVDRVMATHTPEDAAGCGCAGQGAPAGLAWWLFVVAAVWARRPREGG